MYGPSLSNQPAAVQRVIAAHEMAHVVLRHHQLRGIAAAAAVTAAMAAAMIGSTHLPGLTPAIHGILVISVGVIAYPLMLLAYLRPLRRNEDEADALASAWPGCSTCYAPASEDCRGVSVETRKMPDWMA